MLGCRRRQPILGPAQLAAALVSACVLASPASADLKPLAAGVQADFECRQGEGTAFAVTWDVVSVTDGQVQIGERSGGQSYWTESPAHFIGTTLAERRLGADGARRMTYNKGRFLGIGGDFNGLASLNLNSTYSGDVVETLPGGGQRTWQYQFEVEKSGRVDLPGLGQVAVTVVREQRSTGAYMSGRRIIYAPELGLPVAYNYQDNSGADERCKLTAFRSAGSAPPRIGPANFPVVAAAESKPAETASTAPAGFPGNVRDLTIVTTTTNYAYQLAGQGTSPSKMTKIPLFGKSLIGDRVGSAYVSDGKLTIVVGE